MEKNENLHMYIDHFTKMVVAIGGSDESLKYWIFEKGLRLKFTFRETLEHMETQNLKDLPSRVQPTLNMKRSFWRMQVIGNWGTVNLVDHQKKISCNPERNMDECHILNLTPTLS